MIKWKLFGKSKDIDDSESDQDIQEPNQEFTESEECNDTKDEMDNQPLAEYHETLQSGKPTTKSRTVSQGSIESDQRIWRDIVLIEEKVDQLHKTRAEKPITEIDKKVDKLIIDVEVGKKQISRKPANVIYVVSKPQPGQVKGDWAVRSHGKIFSHHRKKSIAIKAARKIAKERDATVLVQNTDGTFSEGFKPRKK
jgi:hypothetical protein